MSHQASAGRHEITTLAMLVGSVAATIAITLGILQQPRRTVQALVAISLVVFLVASRRRLASMRLSSATTALLLGLPLAALLGAAVALPRFPQFFAFRVLLAALLLAVVTQVVAGRPIEFDLPRGWLMLVGAWAIWLVIALSWAHDKPSGFRTLALLSLELVLLLATAMAGTSRRWLRGLLVTLVVGYGLSVLVGIIEVLSGFHLPSSAASGTRARVATGFLFNPNDEATFIAMAWGFLVVGLLTARRTVSALSALVALGAGAWVVLHTGSRSSMIAMAISTAAAPVVLLNAGRLRRPRATFITLFLVLAAFAGLAFNTSENAVLRQFRLSTLSESIETGQGSGATRVALTVSGLRAAAASRFLGVGPGNAEGAIREQEGAPERIANLHNWWMEVLVEGGLLALSIWVVLYVGLLVTSYRAARRARDPFLSTVAAGVVLALLGSMVSALGPSTMTTFAPLWIMLGLAIAVALAVRREADGVWLAPGSARSCPHVRAPSGEARS